MKVIHTLNRLWCNYVFYLAVLTMVDFSNQVFCRIAQYVLATRVYFAVE